MDPIILAAVMFVVVAGGIGLVVYLMKGNDTTKAAERLDTLIGRGGQKDSSSDLLLKQALKEVDRKTMLDVLTPGFLNMTKTFAQADANIKPSALFGISMGLALVGGMVSSLAVGSLYVAP